jgi:hypothetical protein
VSDQQVLEHLVEGLVFVLGQRDIFEEGNVFSPSYSLQFAQDPSGVAGQRLQLLAHRVGAGSGGRDSTLEEKERNGTSVLVCG